MFRVSETGAVTMHVGDTGAYIVTATRESGEPFSADDRLIYTVKNAQNQIVRQQYYELDNDDSIGNGKVMIEFHNADTDTWPVGTYQTELRYVINPYYDENDKIIDGDIVRVPENGQSTLTLNAVRGEV